MKACYIVGAAQTRCAFKKQPGDLLIAADGGYTLLMREGMKPDILMGDFDSLRDIPEDLPVFRHPVMKDDTDTMLAVKLGLERGYRRFFLYGCVGGRTDHTLANIQTLAYIAEAGGEGFLVGEGEEPEFMTVIRNGEYRFSGGRQGRVSVFAQGGQAKGVSLIGLLYPLDRVVLSPSFPLGVSNSFTGREAIVRVEEGELLIIWTGKLE